MTQNFPKGILTLIPVSVDLSPLMAEIQRKNQNVKIHNLFAKITINGKTQATQPSVGMGFCPVWQSQFVYDVDRSGELHVAIYNKDMQTNSDSFVCEGRMKVDQFCY